MNLFSLVVISGLIAFGSENIRAQTKAPPSPKRISIFVYNSNTDRPYQVLEEDFWANKKNIDTIEIRGKHLVDFICKRLASLKDTTIDDYSVKEFDHAFAFMIIEGKVKDTIYADPTLKLFKRKNTLYVDNLEFFKKTFSIYLLF